jgi:hypothetical protein
MLAAARTRLGQIDERLDAASLAPLRRRLRAASARLAEIQEALRQDRTPPDALFARWLADARPLEAELVAAQPASLFNPVRLQIAANRPLPH